jgi:diguanylate cyclase (GGDEF)-like protein/PAS domain S-box-containing protein
MESVPHPKQPVPSSFADDSRAADLQAPGSKGPDAIGRLSELSVLLNGLDENSPPPTPAELTTEQENELIQVRLGIAASLFAALRGKHEPTAKHSLRVAVGCSSWATSIGLTSAHRDEIELAALMHDIGKISVPDNILLKAGSLSTQESAIMDGHWKTGKEILHASCASAGVLEIVANARAWYDGSHGRQQLVGDDIPLGARMLAIVDAFDAMMSDHVYRRALPLDRAFHELYRFAGTQFDPSLVLLFIKLHENDQSHFQGQVVRRWLHELDPEVVEGQWRRGETPRWLDPRTPEALFQQKLLDNMQDAVVFIDASSRIVLWNHGAERLTGISAQSVYQRLWVPSLLRTRDEHGQPIRDDRCPVAHAIHSGVQWIRRLKIMGRNEQELAVDAHAVPVVSADGHTHGLTLVLHDASSEISLEERCHSLHELAKKDPLTQVANRAEFDRMHELFIAAHLERRRPCSLIMGDIDRFKQVNDNYGHQAGDEIIQSFARLLQSFCRPGDLVARYGGEEFVVLCADCDLGAAARRAEEIRIAFSERRQPSLDDKCVTASFGVAEVQPGDTTESLLRRSDRGLLMAKETGRNRVVQLGSGCLDEEHGQVDASLQDLKKSLRKTGGLILSQDLITESPMDRSIEKLRGFIADHHGEIISIQGKTVQISLAPKGAGLFRRGTDRVVGLLMDLTFQEERTEMTDTARSSLTRTRIHLEMRPQRNRDRRKAETLDRARQLLISFRSYLMAIEAAPQVLADPEPDNGLFSRARDFFMPWQAAPAPSSDR